MDDFKVQYEAALRSYLEDGSELALQRAYELGRRGASEGLGILEAASAHHEALAAILGSAPQPANGGRILAGASLFLSECLAPFEMSYRGYRDANEQLRKLAESRAMLLDDLAAKNRELESFSYSVSHDLRAPLRAIDGFSRILIEDYSQALEPEALRLLQVVCDKTAYMEQLINGLLEFARFSRTSMNVCHVNMGLLVQSVFKELVTACPERNVQLDLGAMPDTQGDPFLLRQVFSNLLANAIKYTRPRPIARIEVSGWAEAGANVYSIRDNGVGFDMAFASKLFGIFQRLHPSHVFEGTGIGLSIVQRVIQRHGGKVWAEGKVDDGAVFYFSLPVKAEAHHAA